MRNTVLVITTTILGVIALMIVMTINGRMNRSIELKSNLSSVVEETIENLILNRQYSIHNTNEFLADLTENLVLTVDAVSDVRIDILECDKDRGLLSVKVTFSYVHPNGKPGSITCEKTVILNKLIREDMTWCRVTFYVGPELYKEYIVLEGTILAGPLEPMLSEGTFLGWVNGDGNRVDFSKPITEDVVCFASVG